MGARAAGSKRGYLPDQFPRRDFEVEVDDVGLVEILVADGTQGLGDDGLDGLDGAEVPPRDPGPGQSFHGDAPVPGGYPDRRSSSSSVSLPLFLLPLGVVVVACCSSSSGRRRSMVVA